MMIDGGYIFDILLNLFQGCILFCKWLVTDYSYHIFMGASIHFKPIYILSLGTFSVIFGLHIYHLIKPI